LARRQLARYNPSVRVKLITGETGDFKMAQISLDEAAVRRGVARKTLEAWAAKGLLTLHPSPRSSKQPQGSEDAEPVDNLVDEDELDRVVESLGWLHLSESGWEGSEEA
jgi:hypothetical protein